MKKFILLAIIGVVVATLCSCGSKSVKGADGTEYSSYQEACRHQDFVAAYDWIEKNNGTDDDKDYVFNAEMLYLTSLGTEEASNRIVYLLAEYQIPGYVINNSTPKFITEDRSYEGAKIYINGIKRFNKRCDNVLDMAIAQNNKDLCGKIINIYKADINVKEENSGGFFVLNEPILVYKSKEYAQAKYDEAFGKEKVTEDEESEEVEEAPAQSTSKKKDNSKRRKR